MDLGGLVFLLLVLACPLAMFWMMRGGHGAHDHASHGHAAHGGHGGGHGHDSAPESRSVEELRRRREELDDEIARLEQAADEAKSPSAV